MDSVDSADGVCAIVLAAGLGSRYREHSDEDKLLAPSTCAADAPPVLAETLSALHGVAERLVVVTRDDNHRLLAWLDQMADGFGAQILPVRTDGLGHSLAQAVALNPVRRGWLVALADMPYVDRKSIVRVASAIEPQRLIVPTYEGQRGHPRGIGAGYLDQLLKLDGERGAQALFANSSVIELKIADPGVIQDIDRPTDRREA